MSAMVRSTSIAFLILGGGALGAGLLCVRALRVLRAAMFALSGIRRRMNGAQILDW
jgi:hypothetical protein